MFLAPYHSSPFYHVSLTNTEKPELPSRLLRLLLHSGIQPVSRRHLSGPVVRRLAEPAARDERRRVGRPPGA